MNWIYAQGKRGITTQSCEVQKIRIGESVKTFLYLECFHATTTATRNNAAIKLALHHSLKRYCEHFGMTFKRFVATYIDCNIIVIRYQFVLWNIYIYSKYGVHENEFFWPTIVLYFAINRFYVSTVL